MSFYGVNAETLPSDQRFVMLTSVDERAGMGAEVMNAMFGLDKSQVTDKLSEHYSLLPTNPDDLPVVGLNLVEPGAEGITPAQLVAGYDRIAGVRGVSKMFLWEDMYAKRSAAWWNHRHPQEMSQMTKEPLFGAVVLGATKAPEGTTKTWEQQQKLLTKGLSATETTATEGMTPADAIVADAMTLVSGSSRPRIDATTITRFVQHNRDISDGSGDCGPYAFVVGGQLYLDGIAGGAFGFVGFRRVMGPKA